MGFYKVKGNSNLVRDNNTNAILNTNMTEYTNYLRMRNLKQNENRKIIDMENDLASVKDDLNEIKNLLRSFINESK
jgi:hypothetical protein